ncbi:MAG TPA: hypothetical protein VMB51_01550 [Solirubrobacteraceae bacterium]|nr:hypothetical protein [Solirubrobacteraceae bacterium]
MQRACEGQTGLVITVDELHRGLFDELVQLCTVVQHAFREELELVFAGTGLAAAVSDLLGEGVLTSCGALSATRLGKVADGDVALAIERPVTSAGRAIGPKALAAAVAAMARSTGKDRLRAPGPSRVPARARGDRPRGRVDGPADRR